MVLAGPPQPTNVEQCPIDLAMPELAVAVRRGQFAADFMAGHSVPNPPDRATLKSAPKPTCLLLCNSEPTDLGASS
jgi:hypothetical protein